MAIAPIQTFQNNLNPLQSIMQGNDEISKILQRAIDQSRDRVNNQHRQDQTLVQNMQLAQGLSQRRAQDLDQRLIDTRNFNYRQDQDAIQLGLRQEALGQAQEERLFNRGLAEDRMDLARNADGRAQSALDLRQEELTRDKDFLREVANPTAEDTPMPPTLESLNAQKSQYETGIQAATKLKDAGSLRENQRGLAAIEAAIARQAPTEKPLTRADVRADRRLEMAEKNATQEEIDRQNALDVADVNAFVVPDSAVQQRISAGKVTPENLSEADKAAIQEADALKSGGVNARLNRELAAIQNYDTEEAFVAAGGTNLSDAAKKRRAEFYRRNKGIEPAAKSSGVGDLINGFLGR